MTDDLAEQRGTDYYALLGVDPRATADEIKSAYHRTLLAHHPDKARPSASSSSMDFAQLKQAYATLSSANLRREYDAKAVEVRTQRPAQVVSLDEFEEQAGGGVWRYPCRCGRAYVLREEDMERDVHLVGCEGCSEVVWAGYELADNDKI